jgi:hypothetical protein
VASFGWMMWLYEWHVVIDVAQANDEVTHGPMRRHNVAPSGRSKWFGGSAKYGSYHQIWWESFKDGEIPLSLANYR